MAQSPRGFSACSWVRARIFEAGYTLPDGLAKPWLRAGIDVASGGEKQGGVVFEFDFRSEPDVQCGFLQLHFSY